MSEESQLQQRIPHGYVAGDALTQLEDMPAESAAVVHMDANWAAPDRNGAFGVEYITHPIRPADEADFSDAELAGDLIDTSQYIADFIDAAWHVLEDGGWLILDADSYALPRMVNYLRSEFGEVRADDHAGRAYGGGGYRKTGRVTLTAADGTPDCSTPGQYLSTGGYPVVFAHKGETDRRTKASASQVTRRPQERYGWGSVKPIAPYQAWLDGLCEPGEHVVVPCAGTAPAAIAAERLGLSWTAVDTEPEAREAFERRRDAELGTDDEQATLEVAP